MTTKAEREAAYQALVKLGVPIPQNEIDAVLEAAEGARGVVVETEIERLRQFARWVIEETVFEDGSGSVDGADVQAEAEKLGLLTETEYDPDVHGESDLVWPGDPWFVFSALLSTHSGKEKA